MLAIALDTSRLRVAIVGRGERAMRRFGLVQASGVHDARLYTADLPPDAEIDALDVLYLVDLPREQTDRLVGLARNARILVNVEDQPALCDFHSVAEVRRGDLLLTVSTGGASPGLAARIRSRLAAEFGLEWAERLNLLRDMRAAWRQAKQDVSAETDALLHANGWLV